MKLVKYLLICLAAVAVIGCSGGTEGAGGNNVPVDGSAGAPNTTGAPAVR